MSEQGGAGLGFVQRPSRVVDLPAPIPSGVPGVGVNTRTSLWPNRWPAIALQECIDEVEAAAPDMQAQVKFNLPCQTCPANTGCLNAKRKEIGPLMYDREILTLPRTGESSLFPRALFAPMLQPADEFVPFYRKPFGVEDEYAVVQAWDLAWSEKVGGDYLVCMTALANLVSGRRMLLDIQRWQRQTFQQQIDLIEVKAEQYGADLVVIEGDAAQSVWRQHAAETTQVPVVSHFAGGTGQGDGKGSLKWGVPGLLIEFENRRWQIPYKRGSYHHEEVENLLTEFEAFGWVNGHLQGIGEHDDAVMCFWHLSWGVKRVLRQIGGEGYAGMVPGAR